MGHHVSAHHVSDHYVVGDETWWATRRGGRRDVMNDSPAPRIEHESDRYRGQLERRLATGGFAIVAIAGGALLWLRYGGTAATIALSIVLGGAGLFVLLWLFLSALE